MEFEGRKRIIIEDVEPELDCGHFPAKRVVGEKVVVRADVYADGHDVIGAALLFWREGDPPRESRMKRLVNDRWEGEFAVLETGLYFYSIEGWVDHQHTWLKDLRKKRDAGQDVRADLLAGAAHLEAAAKRALPEDAEKMGERAMMVRDLVDADTGRAVTLALSGDVRNWMEKYPDRSFSTRYERDLPVIVDRQKALFSTWYEFFPRSASEKEGKHGTFRECERLFPEIRRMGFDVVYLPPIHPIGSTHRKGKNNTLPAQPGDPGSPWAIGNSEGGHKSIHPELGTMEDFLHFIKKAEEEGLEVAMDIALQCSPDHPWVKEHPEWFRWRPDGTVQFAENPPKKYEDIIPLNFETGSWLPLWQELKGVVFFWLEKGVRIFRVDNPHTKPFPFWSWLIREVKREYPETIFLSEAFTRPKVMYRLAKTGFTQSYTYFTWRNSKRELTDYLTELTQTKAKEFFRPNFFANTPDILPEFLQYGGRAAFLTRLVLAATLSSNYGIYGPPFELLADAALPGKEEYLDSEKYEIKNWDWDPRAGIRDFIARVNAIRKANGALQSTNNLRFYEIDNEKMLFYGKRSEDGTNMMLIFVTLDPFTPQSGLARLPLEEFGIGPGDPFLVHDLLADDRFIWQGERNRVGLDPRVLPARIFRVLTRMRKEADFDYFM